MKKYIISLAMVCVALLAVACSKQKEQAGNAPALIPEKTSAEQAGISPEVFESGARVRYCGAAYCLIVEFLADDLLHVEYAAQGASHDLSQPLWTSPMVQPLDYAGPGTFEVGSDGSLQTGALRVDIDRDLCLTVTDLARQPVWQFSRICPADMDGYRKHLSIDSPDITDIYGLGEQFLKPGETDGNWFGKVRFPGVDQGNALAGFSQGMVGNAQFSIAYFLGEADKNYALFVDNPAAQTWNLSKAPWDINIAGDAVRFYLFTGSDLPELRCDYMALTGTPPVPPKKMLGLWVSEYGYDNWGELEDKLASLRANRFPVDGFVLDLQWFGGIQSDSVDSAMGGLNWDTVNFPDPAGKIAEYAQQGVGIMTIEEPYISAGLAEYADLAGKGYLVRQCEGCDPVYLTTNPWWGIGSMMDWTNLAGAAYWHDEKRQPLIDMGVTAHWTDLGEPEIFDAVSWYHGVEDGYTNLHNQFDIHNLYNLFWSRSVYEGYARNSVEQRPFIMSRSGAPGSQRYAVSMWSGDIGSNLESLAAHLQVQGNMSLSGMDYFGSDIGGFYRSGAVGGIDNIYTPWLASGALLDVPFRVHTQNLCNCNETAPDRVGDLESNLANVRLRYELNPYLYSLAHRAYLYGEAVFSPLVYYFQQDESVRTLGNHKMLGRDLLTVHSATLYQEFVDVYLPAGDWVDYFTGEWMTSKGQWLEKYPIVRDGIYHPPLFLRAGAIIPLMYVDDQTMNITGARLDGSVRDELVLRMVAGVENSDFILYEDDGTTIAYQRGEVRTTRVTLQTEVNRVTLTVHAAEGTFDGANSARDTVLDFARATAEKPQVIIMNGFPLTEAADRQAWEEMESGWNFDGTGRVLIKTGALDVKVDKRIEINY